MTASTVLGSGDFEYTLPAGAVALPLDETQIDIDVWTALLADTAAALGIEESAPEGLLAASSLALMGSLIPGVDRAAFGMYRSPDDEARPITLLLTACSVRLDFESRELALATLLRELTNGKQAVIQRDLPAGPCVVAITDEHQTLTDGTVQLAVRQHQVTAWVPDPTGATAAVVSVTTNSWRDWEHVSRVTLEVFESIRWERM